MHKGMDLLNSSINFRVTKIKYILIFPGPTKKTIRFDQLIFIQIQIYLESFIIGCPFIKLIF